METLYFATKPLDLVYKHWVPVESQQSHRYPILYLTCYDFVQPLKSRYIASDRRMGRVSFLQRADHRLTSELIVAFLHSIFIQLE